MKIHYNSIFVPPGYRAITIGQHCFCKYDSMSDRTRYEEEAHAEQWKEHGFKFAFMYLWELMRHGYKGNKYEIAAKAIADNRILEDA